MGAQATRSAWHPRALVVDDSASERARASRILRRLKWEATECTHAEALEERVGQVRPDVILLDVMMHPVNGFEACRVLRQSANPIIAQLPIIMCSVKHSATDWVWARQQGADAYLVKPWDSDELAALLRRLVLGPKVWPLAAPEH